MRLAKLTVNGFKSFADRTEFAFDAPVTGIVGPNGCGKSNIVDAIKWVLGERSAKSLRGKEMADVIFAGSAGRKPSGMASVVLTFDNPTLSPEAFAELQNDAPTPIGLADEPDAGTEPAIEPPAEPSTGPAGDAGGDAGLARADRPARRLAIDADTVDVERRLYRDGTSQYLINGKKVRLRDIRELFLDTGVGAHAYSIIEQGKVDALLLANAVERRVFFEEAAGVARFKARRLEAQRKLERSEQNLVRAREQLGSTERRLRTVRGQAAKARRFRELDTELRATKAALFLAQYDELFDRLNGLTSRLQDLEYDHRHAVSGVESLEARKQEAELRRHELAEARRDAEQQRAGAESVAAQAEHRRATAERESDELRRRAERDAERLEQLAARIDALTGEATERSSAAETLAQQAEDADRALSEASAARESVQTALVDARRDVAERSAQLAGIDRERAGLDARCEAVRHRREVLAEQHREFAQRRDAIEAKRAALSSSIDGARRDAELRRRAIAEHDRSIDDMLGSAADLSSEQRARTAALNDLERERAAIDGRRLTLEEMAEAREGFGEAVRAVLDQRDTATPGPADGPGVLPRIIAPLAELIDVDAEHAALVEAALGPLLQALVVDASPADVAAAPDLASLAGRVTLLPARRVLPHTPPAGSDHQPADPPLAAVVRCDPRVADLVASLLGRTHVARDLDAALLRLAAGGGVHRFVTPGGEVLDADGTVTAGPAPGAGSAAGGLLQRASELAGLRQRLASIDEDLARLRVELRTLDERVTVLHDRLSDRQDARAADERALVADENRVERHRADLDRLAQERSEIDAGAERTAERLGALDEERAELDDRVDKLRRLHDEHAALADGAHAEVERRSVEVELATDRVTAARIEVSQIGEQLAAARREVRRLEDSAADIRAEQDRLGEEIESSRRRSAQHTETIAGASRERERAAAEAAEAAERASALADEADDAAERAERLAAELSDARSRAAVIDRDWNALEMAKREAEIRRETIEHRAGEELTIDLPVEHAEYRALMASGGVSPAEPESAAAEIERLKAGVAALGNVNLGAIEEETSLEDRNEDLARQVADIDAARAALEDLITRLNDASLDRFKAVFTQIEQRFSGKDGMFRRLFGGGRAELKLLPDPETGRVDWLESGIEVLAKPPGKEPRSISQLSGGEKTMTAVALLMSIFEAKPSPFCVLDEVDAALDDANVDRFCAIVRRFLGACHFVVITHNKRTMQTADQLFGVTMQERGVSTRVNVRFDDVGADGHIRTRAQAQIDQHADDDPAHDRPATKPGPVAASLAELKRHAAEPAPR